MKLLDIISETDEDKKIKKAKTVYKAYKKGFLLKKGIGNITRNRDGT